jgi:hypothetical protein
LAALRRHRFTPSTWKTSKVPWRSYRQVSSSTWIVNICVNVFIICH